MDQVNTNKMESDQNNQRMKAKESEEKSRHETSSLIFDGPAPNPCPEGGFFSKKIGTFREHSQTN